MPFKPVKAVLVHKRLFNFICLNIPHCLNVVSVKAAINCLENCNPVSLPTKINICIVMVPNTIISINSISDLVVLSNLIGKCYLDVIEYYSLPKE